jgi:hypothetical protein
LTAAAGRGFIPVSSDRFLPPALYVAQARLLIVVIEKSVKANDLKPGVPRFRTCLRSLKQAALFIIPLLSIVENVCYTKKPIIHPNSP